MLSQPARVASGSWPQTGAALSVVEGGLDVVAVGVEHERAVIARVVLRPLAGRTVVAVAGGDHSVVEPFDGVEVGHAEGKVDVLRRLFVCGQGRKSRDRP